MRGILLDENLPQSLVLPSGHEVTHASSLGENPSDTEIWDFAKKERLLILTKDADFSARIAVSDPPPWAVHIRAGNMRLKPFITHMEKIWPQVEAHFPEAKLVEVYTDRVTFLT